LGLQITIIGITAILASLAGLLSTYYLDFSIEPAIALFWGRELIKASLIARLRQGILHLQSK